MEFKKYTSLGKPKDFDYARDSFIIPAINNNLLTNLFLIQEKLHGANFSFRFDFNGKDVVNRYICSRNQVIGDGDNFKGASIVKEKYQGILEYYAVNLVKGELVNVDSVIIYGEIAGGGIQHGVNYGDIDFYAFDIMISYKNNDDFWLSPCESLMSMHEIGVPIAPVLAVGSFDKITKFSCEFGSHVNPEAIKKNGDEFSFYVNAFLGNKATVDPRVFTYMQEAQELKDNFAEGYVLRPVFFDSNKTSMYIEDTVCRYRPSFGRLIFKIKHPSFSERKNRPSNKHPRQVVIEDKDLLVTVESFIELINEQRVIAVLSKEVNVEQKNFGQYLKLILEDCLEEYDGDKDTVNFIIGRKFKKDDKDLANAHTMIHNSVKKELQNVFKKGIY